jgi:2-isopropylmalate synthase
MWSAFQSKYLPASPAITLVGHELHTTTTEGSGRTSVKAVVDLDGDQYRLQGQGDGPVEAFVNALRSEWGIGFDVVDYSEHAIGRGADARAVAYVESIADSGEARWGVGLDLNIATATLLAVLSAFERQVRQP